MLYEDDSPLYEILWGNRSFLNGFGFNCVSIFANVIIFLHDYVSKNLKSVYLSKKLYENNQPLYEILWWIKHKIHYPFK